MKSLGFKKLVLALGIILVGGFARAGTDSVATAAIKSVQSDSTYLAKIKEIGAKPKPGASATLLSSFGDGGWANRTYLVTLPISCDDGTEAIAALVQFDLQYVDDGGEELKGPTVILGKIQLVDFVNSIN